MNQAMPPISIPLANNEQLNFDFMAVYQQTFEGGKWANFVNYSALPVRFETYRDDDKTAILDLMRTQKGD